MHLGLLAQLSEWQAEWDRARQFITQAGLQFGLNLIAAIAIFFVGRWITGILTRLATRFLVRTRVDATLANFLANILYVMLLAFVVITALGRLGVDTTSFAAIIAAAGLAVGLALQNSLSNFASGVMLILFKPFKVGDSIQAAGTSGVVEDIHIFTTQLRTPDNVQITVPNGQVTSGIIINFSAKATRRIDLTIGCGYDDDLKSVKSFLEGLVTSDERILRDPAPVVAVDALADSSVNFAVQAWVRNAELGSVRRDLIERIKLGFDEHGFTIPYPTRSVYVESVAT